MKMETRQQKERNANIYDNDRVLTSEAFCIAKNQICMKKMMMLYSLEPNRGIHKGWLDVIDWTIIIFRICALLGLQQCHRMPFCLVNVMEL
jgi:hypothetical protein